MARRVTDQLAGKVRQAIEDLPILSAIKEQIEWEVVPYLAPDREQRGAVNVAYLIGAGLPVPGTGDYIIPFRPVRDPHDSDEVRQVVLALYQDAQAEIDQQRAQAVIPLNGHKTSPGGLALPQ